MPEPDVSFTLDNETLNKLKRAASTLGHSNVSITPSGGGILSLSVVDNENSTSNTYSIDIDGDFGEAVFNFVLNISNLKILPGDYDVSISSKLISNFSHKELNINYWIALEKTSTFNK